MPACTIKPKALFVLGKEALSLIYGPDDQRTIAEWTDIVAPPQTPETIAAAPDLLQEVEVIFSGWGAPVFDTALLTAAPKLRAVFYGAGATGGLLHPDVWERGIVVTSASSANAVPVAEFTLAATLFALKNALPLMRQIHAAGAYRRPHVTVAGAYGATVGLVSLGEIGRATAERIRAVTREVTLLAYDPFVSPTVFIEFGVELVGLDALFARSDVVSLHTPWLPETEGMIRGHHLRAMKPGATLINTARGALIAEEEMVAALTARPDLTAILDVIQTETPESESALFRLDNVFITPHIAGSLDRECQRMGRFMAEELRRYCLGKPMLGTVRPESAQHTTHRLPIM